MLDVVQQKEGERKAGGRLDCPGSLAADDGHCLHRRDDGESCCWCEDECECHDEDFSASGVRGVHANDVAMAAGRGEGVATKPRRLHTGRAFR